MALLFGLAGLAAWQIPPRLEWARLRPQIAALASAELGRPVAIGGDVAITLLPEAVVEAQDVSLADRGDGISARFGALRLRVAFWPLLRGRVLPRELMLDRPAVTLPARFLPGSGQGPSPLAFSLLPRGFTGHVDAGWLRIGERTMGPFSGDVAEDADTGALTARGRLGAGESAFSFTFLLGSPAPDGAAPLSATLDRQEPSQGLSAHLMGRLLLDGSLRGALVATGSDLSALFPAPSFPWRLRTELVAERGLVRAPAIRFSLGQSPGTAQVTLRLSPSPSLEGQAQIGQMPLGPWVWQARRVSPFPVRMRLKAEALKVAGVPFRDVDADLVADGVIRIESLRAALPGGGNVALSGQLSRTGLDGAVTLNAPDLATALAAARPVLPDSLMVSSGSTASLSGTISLRPDSIDMAGAHGQLSGQPFSGSFSAVWAGRPSVHINVSTRRLSLPPDGPHRLPGLRAIASGLDLDLRLAADQAIFRTFSFPHVVLDLHAGEEGVVIRRLSTGGPDATLALSGSFGADGAIGDGRAELTARDASFLPAPWRRPAGLWHGPLHAVLTASGPARKIAVQMRGDLGDLRAEAEGEADWITPALDVAISVRHPGAPRLLAALGYPGLEPVIDTGSFAVLARLIATPLHVSAENLNITAATFRIDGDGQADLSGPVPVVTGTLHAGSLALPAMNLRSDTPLPAGLSDIGNVQIALKADEISAGLRPVLKDFSATLAAGPGQISLSKIAATLAGGSLDAEAHWDEGVTPPRLAMRGALHGASPDLMPLPGGFAWHGGSLDMTGQLAATGYSPASLRATAAGKLQGTLREITFTGLDLAEAGHLLQSPPPKLRAALAKAMGAGETAPLNGTFQMIAADDALTYTQCQLEGSSGSIAVSGAVDGTGSSSWLTLSASPASVPAPALRVEEANGQRKLDVTAALAWAAAAKRSAKAGSASIH